MADNTISADDCRFPPTRKMIFSTQLYFWMQEEHEEEGGWQRKRGKGTCNSDFFPAT